MVLEIVVSIGILLLGAYLYSQRRPQGFPPGPWGYPILGHLPILGPAPYKTCTDWKPKYGPIVGLDFGQFPCVAISDYKLIRQAMNMNAFTGRPDLQPFLDRSGGQRRGILFADGEEWAEQRKFTFRHLKEFGFGKNTTESVINEEMEHVISHMRGIAGQSLSIRSLVNVVAVNAIWTLTTSERFEPGDPNLLRILEAVTTNIAENNGLADLGMFMPWFARLFPKFSGYEAMMKDLVPLLNFLDAPVLHHKKTHVTGQARDFLDVYIEEIKRTTDPNSSFYRRVGDISMRTVLLDLFTAGTETTSNSVSWFCLYLAVHPEIQAKLHETVDRQIGRNRRPLVADREFMPYFEAATLELLRISAIVSSGIFRNTLQEAEIGGFRIPSNTMVLLNLYDCNHDVGYWGDPKVFRPERFLSQDGCTVIKHEAFMAFGTGKRVCPGEKFALSEMFLIVATILQNFRIVPDPEAPLPSLEPTISFVLQPQPHKLVFLLRD